MDAATVFFMLAYGASCLSAMLPFAAYEFVQNWDRVFDCFSALSLGVDLVVNLFKLSFLLFGLGKDQAVKVLDGVTALYITVTLTGACLFVNYSLKKRYKVLERLFAPSVALGIFLLSSMTAFAIGTQAKWAMSESTATSVYIGLLIALMLQAALPVVQRLVNSEQQDDEPKVLAFKLVSTALIFFSSLCDYFSFKQQHYQNKRWTILSMCLVTVCLSGVTFIVRCIGPARVIEGAKSAFAWVRSVPPEPVTITSIHDLPCYTGTAMVYMKW